MRARKQLWPGQTRARKAAGNLCRRREEWCKAKILKLKHDQNHPEDLYKTQIAESNPQFLIQSGYGGVPKFAFLTSFQVMLMLLNRQRNIRVKA